MAKKTISFTPKSGPNKGKTVSFKVKTKRAKPLTKGTGKSTKFYMYCGGTNKKWVLKAPRSVRIKKVRGKPCLFSDGCMCRFLNESQHKKVKEILKKYK